MAAGTAVLLVVPARAASPSGRGSVALGPIRSCGRLSYELYLFHVVLLGAFRTVWPPEATSAGARLALLVAYLAAATSLAALVSRFYAEPLNRRFRAGKRPSARRTAA